MTNFSESIYLCSECKKIMGHLDDLLFIDEYSHKGFCCEDCIEDYYFPLIKHFEMVEHSLRRKHDLVNELPINTIIGPDMIEATLENPDEVFRQTNELNETYYYFIKKINDFFVVVISSVYRKEASFVFLVTKTMSQALITEFRYGEMMIDWELKIEDEDEDGDENEIEISVELETNDAYSNDEDEDEDMIFIQSLENKKSNILADILMMRKEDDIPFEDYTGYEFCFQETLDFPDEVFEKKDKEGDIIFTYIKAFLRGHETFYYIVTCLKRMIKDENVNVYPILAMPTFDMELCQEFRGGTKLSGPLKN